MIKKLIEDFAYILLAVALVFGVVQLALPDINVDISSGPLVPEPTPAPNYVIEIEALAVDISGHVPPETEVLVLVFWSPDCDFCVEELVALNLIVETRPDVVILGITTETDPEVVDAILQELGLGYFVLYGLPRFPISYAIPNTHVLIKEEGVWRLEEGGTWIGFVRAEVIIQYIDERRMNDNYVPERSPSNHRATA